MLKIVTLPIRIFYDAVLRLLPLPKSTPTRWWLTLTLSLLLIWIAVCVRYRLMLTASSVSWVTLTILLAIALVLPLTIYFALRQFTRNAGAPGGLDTDLQAGLRACEQNGIRLDNLPLFLVLGVPGKQQAKQLISASSISFKVSAPADNSPEIQLFANSESAFLFVSCCATSRLSLAPVSSKIQPLISRSSIKRGLTAAPENYGTIDEDSLAAPQEVYRTVMESSPNLETEPEEDVGRATLMLGEGQNISDFLRESPELQAVQRVRQLSPEQLSECNSKLQHLCQFLLRLRGTNAPIQGIITALPFELISNSSTQLQEAVKQDLGVLRKQLAIRCQNVALVTGIESEQGFSEMLRRVGVERSQEFRFGKGFEIWNSPERKKLDAVTMHAVGAFEDWIYMLFQQQNFSNIALNGNLFQLLAKIRGQFVAHLRAVLSNGFGYDPQSEPELSNEQFLFGGCYFAAAGGSTSQQAFVKSVFLKTIQQQGELQWNPSVVSADTKRKSQANFCAFIGLVAAISIIGMLIAKFALAG